MATGECGHNVGRGGGAYCTFPYYDRWYKLCVQSYNTCTDVFSGLYIFMKTISFESLGYIKGVKLNKGTPPPAYQIKIILS